MSETTMPRSVSRVLAAQSSPNEMLQQLTTEINGFKKRHDDTLSGVQSSIDDIHTRLAALGLSGGPAAGGGSSLPIEPDYSKAYASWVRSGANAARDDVDVLVEANRSGVRKDIMASMSAGSATDGGYLAPIEWDRSILKALEAQSPMRRLATVVNTNVRGYSTLWNEGGWGTGWVGETAERSATSTATLKPVTFSHGEIYANPAITQKLLDDADFPLEQWISDEISREFANQESIAFISGDGVNKPRGLLTYVVGGASETEHPAGPITVVNSGTADGIGTPDALVDFVYGLPAPYRQNAKWLMGSTTAAVIAKMKDGDGNYLWRGTYVAGQPPTLLGYSVEIDESMPVVAAGNLPIAFGDFARGYVINDRFGVRLLRDPYTNKPFVHFYTTKRVGGGIRDPKAIRLMRIAA